MFLKIKKAIKNPRKTFTVLLELSRIDRILSDETYLEIFFRARTGKKLNLKNPQTFNEKLQWLKLNNRKPEYTMMVDKYEVRKYIADTIGEEYLIPLLGVWDNADDIDFDKLPNQFVLKCNHNSGLGMVICKDKSKLDIKEAREGLRKGLKEQYYLSGREWPYKNVKPRIIAEKYMIEPSKTELSDYKIYCFNGKPEYIQVISDRTTIQTIDFFDKEWKHQEFTGLAKPHKSFSKNAIPTPQNLKLMLDFSEILAKDNAFVRIDFYEISDRIYFGEITFFPASGFGAFSPKEWDYTLGSWIDLEGDYNEK